MLQRIVHLCYSGTSGSSRTAVNIAAGSAEPKRHAYVLYGARALRADYSEQLDELGCEWRYVRKPRGLLSRAYRRVAPEILRLEPACVFFHGSRSLPLLWRLQLKSPALATMAVQHGPSREITSWCRRQTCVQFSEAADRTVTVSDGMAELIDRYRTLADACRPLTVIPNGVDVDYWHDEPPAPPASGPVRLVMVATLDARKGHKVLLRAVAELRSAGRNVACDIVGDGPKAHKLEALAAKLGIADIVQFRGDTGRDGVRDALRQAHIVCHAALTESFGLAVLEAMAAARPVVATATIGVREIIEHERTGLLVQPGDPDAMAAAIARLIENTQMGRDMALAARQVARDRYSHRRMAAAYEDIADQVMRGRANT